MKARILLLLAFFCLLPMQAQYFNSYSVLDDEVFQANSPASQIITGTAANGKFYYTGYASSGALTRLYVRNGNTVEEIPFPFDILTFEIEVNEEPYSITDGRIVFVTHDNNFDLILATDFHVLRYKNNNWEILCNTYPAIGPGDIVNIKCDAQNNIWFTYRTSPDLRNFICKINGNSIESHSIPLSITEWIDTWDSDFEIDQANNIWISRRFENDPTPGVSKFDGTNWTNFSTSEGLISNEIMAIEKGPNGTLWFGTRAGISIFDGNSFISTITSQQGLESDLVYALAFDGTNMFISSENSMPNDGRLQIYTPSGFKFLSLPDIYEPVLASTDINGNFWFYNNQYYFKYNNTPAAKLNVNFKDDNFEGTYDLGVDLKFCRTSINGPQSLTAKLFNTSFLQTLSISDIILTGTDADQFRLEEITTPNQLEYNASTSFKIVFAPTHVGSFNALLTIKSNDYFNPVVTFPLSGTGSEEFITGPTSLCNGQTTATYQVTSTLPEFRTYYHWDLPANFTMTSHNSDYSSISVSIVNGNSNQTISAFQNDFLNYNNCFFLETRVDLNIQSTATQLGGISGPIELCPNTSGTYQVVTNAASVQWNCSGCTILSGLGSNAVQIKKNATSTPAQLTASISSCNQTINQSISISENNGLSIPVIVGNADFCLNQSVAFSVDNHASSSYQWITPQGYSITSGQGTSSITITNQGIPQAGNLKVIESNSCGNSPTAELALAPKSYSLSNVDFNCVAGSEIFVAVNSNIEISSGTIGIDFTLNFDGTKLVPSGNYQLGGVSPAGTIVSINKNTSGQVSVSMFLSDINAPFSGSGTIVKIGFKRLAAFTVNTTQGISCNNGIMASTFLGNSIGCAPTPAVIGYPSYFTGKILYQNSTTIVLAGGGSQLPTNISLADAACNKDAWVTNTDANGTFKVIGNSTLTKLNIQRDVPGDRSYNSTSCSVVNAFVNGQDALLASQISSKAIASPSLYQLLAADVNLDGKVTAADATLIQTRSVNGLNCEFPQSHNYSVIDGKLQPNVNYIPSTDWLFIDATYFNSAAFKTNASSTLVPKVPGCLSVAGLTPTTCNSGVNQNFISILLGDVNANWNTSNASNAKALQNGQLTLHLNEAENSTADSYWIPVSASLNQAITSIDFAITSDSTKLEIEEIESIQNSALVVNHITNSRVMLSSYLSTGFENDKIFRIKVKSKEAPSLKNFGDAQVFINGESASFGDETSSYSSNNDVLAIAPNPFHDKLTIEGLAQEKNVVLQLISLQGKIITETSTSGNEIEVDASVPAGTYFLKVEYNGKVKVEKVIKY